MIKKNIIEKLNINDKDNRKKTSHLKTKNIINEYKKKEKRFLHYNNSVKIFKPNCYFNKINLDKVSKKISSYESSI